MIEKRISYKEDNGSKNVKVAKKPLPKDWEPKYLNGNVIDITPLIEDEWWKPRPEPNDDESKNYPQGLESLVASRQIPGASIKDQFQTYYSVLSRYFSPSDLRGKSLMELDRMLQMFIKSNGGLF